MDLYFDGVFGPYWFKGCDTKKGFSSFYRQPSEYGMDRVEKQIIYTRYCYCIVRDTLISIKLPSGSSSVKEGIWFHWESQE